MQSTGQSRRFINPAAPHLWHGGDYNPEQWERGDWELDMDLMDQAQVNVATVGVFSWASIEPAEGRYEWGWLDEALDLLASRGKRAILATPSAAMPAWLSKKHPEILRTGPDGVRRRHGERVNFCWSHPEYLDRCRTMSTLLAERYGEHPALVMWHVSNEYGGACHCERCERRFREWLQRKFDGNLDRLNRAYWTRFWSHRFTEWDQIEIPGGPYGETSMPGLSLDWRRFVTWQVVEFFLNESRPLREHAPGVPVATNMMGTYPGIDYWKLAEHVDVAAWDSYPCFVDRPIGVSDWHKVALQHDLNRSFHPDRPFLLIECSPDSSNWYPVMQLKRPGLHSMEGLLAVAHGSDGVLYFQWRQSRGGIEKFHGAVITHDGRSDTRVFREVASLGASLRSLEGVAGTTVESDCALVYDWENGWAIELAGGPHSERMDYGQTCVAHYGALARLGASIDVVEQGCDFDRYRLIVAPMLYLLKPGVADRLERFVFEGGTLVCTYWTGIVDENDLLLPGPRPGPLAKVLGIRAEETDGLHEGASVRVRFNQVGCSLEGRVVNAHILCDLIQLEGAEQLAAYEGEFYARTPAVTAHRYGQGRAYYVGARLEQHGIDAIVAHAAAEADIRRSLGTLLPEGVIARKRLGGDREYLFVLNLLDSSIEVPVVESGWRDVANDSEWVARLTVPGYGVAVAMRPIDVRGQGDRAGRGGLEVVNR